MQLCRWYLTQQYISPLVYRWYLAQRYVTDPLLIGGLKSGLRVWVLVPDTKPLRVYMHCNGLVLFSDSR